MEKRVCNVHYWMCCRLQVDEFYLEIIWERVEVAPLGKQWPINTAKRNKMRVIHAYMCMSEHSKVRARR